MKKDYYSILGISKQSTKEEIKKAYKKLAHKYHPDKNKSAGSEENFKDVNEAYEVLGNFEKRKQYDYESSKYNNNKNMDFSSVFNGDDFFNQMFGNRTNSY